VNIKEIRGNPRPVNIKEIRGNPRPVNRTCDPRPVEPIRVP
jgi:hypothetical protein